MFKVPGVPHPLRHSQTRKSWASDRWIRCVCWSGSEALKFPIRRKSWRGELTPMNQIVLDQLDPTSQLKTKVTWNWPWLKKLNPSSFQSIKRSTTFSPTSRPSPISPSHPGKLPQPCSRIAELLFMAIRIVRRMLNLIMSGWSGLGMRLLIGWWHGVWCNYRLNR